MYFFQGGVGKVTGLRRGSHEAVLAQNQELEGDGKTSGGSGSLGQSKLRVRVVQDEVCCRWVSRQGGWRQKPALAWEVARGRKRNERDKSDQVFTLPPIFFYFSSAACSQAGKTWNQFKSISSTSISIASLTASV